MIRNDFDPQTGQPLDLGVDPYVIGVTYANGELVTRLLDYLTDEDGLLIFEPRKSS